MGKRKNNIVVIFSSHLTEKDNEEFIGHINKTIGVQHKTVAYPNFNQFSLSEVYNDAIKTHSVENCIFVMCHNDITLKTKNWGKVLLNKFNNSDYGIIGIAGTTYLPDSGKWWEDRSKMLGIVEHTNGVDNWVSNFSKPIHGVKDAVLIDGLFMSFDPNKIINTFDESYKGFHFYDIGFCIPNYLDGVNIGVTTSIRVLHASVGETNQGWEDNRIQFVNEYVDELPITVYPTFTDEDIKLDSEPKVTVIIPTKNNLKYIRNNINSWNDIVKYSNYEIIIADTGSDDDVIAAYSEFLNDSVRLVKYNYYNFGKINNDVVNNHVSDDTELLLFCNDDIKLINDVLSRCVREYNRHMFGTIGTIGIRLHYSDGSVQHNGITIKAHEGEIKLSHRDLRKTEQYCTRGNDITQGNTGGFMMIEKYVFDSYGGFNEEYIECLEDVELNMKCTHNGLINITVTGAVAFHYESVSRNKYEGGQDRFMTDYGRLKEFVNNNNIKI